MSEYVVELRNATKRFPGVVALKNMQLAVKPGVDAALVGAGAVLVGMFVHSC